MHSSEFKPQHIPPYAIVSHRWEDSELTFSDMRRGTGIFEKKRGFHKLRGACRMAAWHGCEWVWLDTCCIDKSSSSELTEAINSMYKWYRGAEVCLVYLYDYSCGGERGRFEECEWFRRGWTLQELIAPVDVAFFDAEWRFVGWKAGMSEMLAGITGIDINVLRGADPSTCSIAQRMSWAAKRETTQIEDQAYALLGLFNVTMPMLYGEGERAFQKLQEEIIKYSNDHTIFAWNGQFPKTGRSGLLARSPACFAQCQNIVQGSCLANNATGSRLENMAQGFSMTNVGISITLLTIPYAMHTYFAILGCRYRQDLTSLLGIFLEQMDSFGQYVRVEVDGRSVRSIDHNELQTIVATRARPMLIKQVQIDLPLQQNYAFWLRSCKLRGHRSADVVRAKAYSRDGRIHQNDGTAVLTIPTEQYGTAGLVKLRSNYVDDEWWCLKYLVFGFNQNFTPCCMLGHGNLGGRSHTFVRDVPEVAAQDDLLRQETFSNSWLQSKPSKSCRADFKAKFHCIVDTSLARNGKIDIDYLGISIAFEQVYAPEWINHLKPYPSLVWAVDIERIEGPSPKTLAEREMFTKGRTTVQNGLSKTLKHVIISSIGAEALSVL